jgi:hypothetical protein
MKKIGTYTLRGQLAGQSTGLPTYKQLNLFDGSFKTAYRVTQFIVAARDAGSANDVVGKLTTEPISISTTGLASVWNWQDNREIAWASTEQEVTSVRQNPFSLVDPDNLIVEDLYITVTNNVGSGELVNYFIQLEKYDITEAAGALAMVRNSSQNVE